MIQFSRLESAKAGFRRPGSVSSAAGVFLSVYRIIDTRCTTVYREIDRIISRRMQRKAWESNPAGNASPRAAYKAASLTKDTGRSPIRGRPVVVDRT